MTCIELPAVQAWLNQFHYLDRAFAEQLLCKMRYVGFEDFETNLIGQVVEVLEEIESDPDMRGRVAIFPVNKPPSTSDNGNKENKADNDSAGRVSHALRNLERANARRFELTPRVQSMREKRVRHVIFVDDFLGTGTRFVKFWQSNVSGSLKSWASFGWVNFWIVTYAAHTSGIHRVAGYVNQLHEGNVRCHLRISRSFIGQREEYWRLTEKYGVRLFKQGASLGYGGILSPVVFQHGCPNNVPGIFWGTGRKLSRKDRLQQPPRWEPLFPNRSIPSDLYPLFTEDLSGEALPEDLWNIGHYRLAVEFLNKLQAFGKDRVKLAVLAYLKKNAAIEKIQAIHVFTDTEMASQLDELLKYGLIDNAHAVTRFGEEVLVRTTKRVRAKTEVPGESYMFFPQTFLGFHREP